MLGLTSLGIFHTAVAAIAVGAGAVALVRDKEISPRKGVGVLYIVLTVVTCLTSLAIFQHGGFGKPHVLAIVTLAVLTLAAIAGFTTFFGGLSRYIEVVAYSLTFFFHWVPATAETLTRLPAGAPAFASLEAPGLHQIHAVLFLLFLVGAAIQVRRLRVTGRTLV